MCYNEYLELSARNFKKKNEKGVDNQMKWERRRGEYTQELQQAGKSSKIQFLQLMKKPTSLYSPGEIVL